MLMFKLHNLYHSLDYIFLSVKLCIFVCKSINLKHDRQCMYNVTLRGIHVNFVAVEKK